MNSEINVAFEYNEVLVLVEVLVRARPLPPLSSLRLSREPYAARRQFALEACLRIVSSVA